MKYIWNKIDYFDPEILEEMVEEKIMIVYPDNSVETKYPVLANKILSDYL